MEEMSLNMSYENEDSRILTHADTIAERNSAG